jgi:hypothetical protein
MNLDPDPVVSKKLCYKDKKIHLQDLKQMFVFHLFRSIFKTLFLIKYMWLDSHALLF